jgi:hypothetical protein
MTHKFNISLTAELTAQTVSSIIKQAVEAQTGKKVASIKVKTANTFDFRGESTGSDFTGCTVTFVDESADHQLYNDMRAQFRKVSC